MLIEDVVTPSSALPVPESDLVVTTLRRPRIERVVSQAGPDRPIFGTHTLAIQGIQLGGAALGEVRAALDRDVSRASGGLALDLLAIAAHRLSTDPRELDGLARLLEREASLGAYVLLLDCEDLDNAEAGREAATVRAIGAVGVPLVVSTRDRRRTGRRRTVAIQVRKPTPSEQRQCWRQALDGSVSSDTIDALVARFDLGPGAIRDAYAQAVRTRAAGVTNGLACELGLDLYRIDLSQVVSKYIGETESTCGGCSTPPSRAARCCTNPASIKPCLARARRLARKFPKTKRERGGKDD